MNAKINLELFKTTTFDSGALGMLAMSLHQFQSPGAYHVSIKRMGRETGEASFVVDEKSEAMQLDIDLAQRGQPASHQPADCDCKKSASGAQTLSPNGYALFHASSGDGYSAVVTNADGKVVFDTAKLGEGDLFAVSLLEPGAYTLANTPGGAKGEIVVSLPPQVRGRRLRDLETLNILASPKKFDRPKIEALSAQGLVFKVTGERTRIQIQKKAERGVARQARPIKPAVRWQKPE